MKKILIVDDQANIRKLLRLTLELYYRVSEAADAVGASAMLANENPDLVLLDIMMPGINGLEWCALTKKQAGNQNIKIIFVSARGQAEDIKTGIAAGADDYIIKPFSPLSLLKVVERHLDANQAVTN